MLGAVIAALCSFVYAKMPGTSHGGGSGYSRAAVDHATRGDARNAGRYYGATKVSVSRNNLAERHARLPHGGANLNGGNYANGFGGYNTAMPRVAGPAGYPGDHRGDHRGGIQYAGAITPVSAESRPVPRPPPNAPVRAGSIRADVARYNEERGSSRAMPRQADYPRQPEGSPYRN